MIFEWNIAKARNNRRKHGVSFEEAATVFLDPLALTFADPDHSAEEEREITVDRAYGSGPYLCRIANVGNGPASSAPGKRPEKSRLSMKKVSTKKSNGLRREYDLTRLGASVRGKYYSRAISGTNLVLLEPELARVFKDSASVNRALRLLLAAAESAASRTGRSRPSRIKQSHSAK